MAHYSIQSNWWVHDVYRIAEGGESLGDEESCKEEKEVSPALILASGVRPLAPDVNPFCR